MAGGIFEGAIKSANETIDTIYSNIDTVFNGTQTLSPGELKTAGINERIKDIGVLGVINLLASVDLCSILAYEANLLSNIQGYKFDPNNPPNKQQFPSVITQKGWLIQKAAYEIQLEIDNYNAANGQEVNMSDLIALIGDVVIRLKNLNDPKSQANIVDPTITTAFTTLNVINIFVSSAIIFLNTYVTAVNISNEDLNTVSINSLKNKTSVGGIQLTSNTDLKKVLVFLNNIRTTCVRIQAINVKNPQSAIASAALAEAAVLTNSLVQAQLAQLNSVLGNSLTKLVPSLQNIQQQCVSIERFCSMILSTIRTCQTYVNIAAGLVKVFSTIVSFLGKLPIPNEFTIVGITTTVAGAAAKINSFLDKILLDIAALNDFLSLMVNLVSSISGDLNQVVQSLNIIIINLESCQNAPPGLVESLKASLIRLNGDSAAQTPTIGLIGQLNKFVENSQKKKNAVNTTYGGYTIQIISEQLLDPTVKIYRRYGIALDSNGFEVVHSTPTYASNDNIIIEEVQLLLESKKLVQIPNSSLSKDQLATIQEALSYIEDNTQSLDFLSNIDTQVDPPDNEDEDAGLGLNAFMNKQKGGKALRRRMRKAMAQATAQLQQNLMSANKG